METFNNTYRCMRCGFSCGTSASRSVFKQAVLEHRAKCTTPAEAMQIAMKPWTKERKEFLRAWLKSRGIFFDEAVEETWDELCSMVNQVAYMWGA